MCNTDGYWFFYNMDPVFSLDSLLREFQQFSNFITCSELISITYLEVTLFFVDLCNDACGLFQSAWHHMIQKRIMYDYLIELVIFLTIMRATIGYAPISI